MDRRTLPWPLSRGVGAGSCRAFRPLTGALSHDVIHGLDITVALGLDHRVPAERVGLVLSGMRPKNLAFFGTDLTGVRLAATDLDWSYGTGAPLHGLARHLLLVACGRRLPPQLLQGAPATRFTR